MAKKKGSKKNAGDDSDDGFTNIEALPLTPSAENDDNPEIEEGEDNGLMGMISQSVKKNKKKKANKSQSYGFNSDDDDKVPDLLSQKQNLGSDEEEDVFGQIVSKKKNKKGKAKGFTSFADLMGLNDDSADDDELDIPLPVKKSNKKKASKASPSFADLELEEEDMEVEPAPVKKDKKSKKNKKELPAFDEEIDYNEPIEETVPAPSKKDKKNKKNKKDLPAFDEPIDYDEPIVEEAPKSNKKGKKSKKDLPAFDDPIDYDEPIPEPTPSTTKKGKKNKKDMPAFDDPIDYEEPVAEPAPAPSKKEKKGKKQDAELDALAALIEEATPEPAAAPKGKKGKKKGGKSEEADGAAAPAATETKAEATPQPEQTGEKKKKKRNQMTSEELKKAQAQAPKIEETPLMSKGKKGKAPNAAILALRKQQEALKAAQDEIKRIEEEEKKALERQRQLEQEEKAKEAERLLKRQANQEKRNQLLKEGKILTKAQKEARKRQQEHLQVMLASGVVVAGLANKDDAEVDGKPKKMVYDDKKKKKKQQQKLAAAASASAPKEEAVESKKEASISSDKEDGVKESWDASDEEKPAVEEEEEEDVKDNWDDESEEEAEEVKEEVETNKANQPPKSIGKDDEDSDDSEEESSDEDSSDEDSSDEEELSVAQRMALQKKQEALERRQRRIDAAMAARSSDDLRSPICCILGHVDTGKTKLLDKIRQTNVQEGEAGGITQQIGATYFPVENIIQKTSVLGEDLGLQYKLPGLLVIDTPGHESFTNLRTRGSSLCNIAILVVDLMHGLEPQTLESIRLLRERKTPFIVALNKIDRIYGWKAIPDNGFRDSLAQQDERSVEEFNTRVEATITAFAEQGLNAKLYYNNENFGKYVSFVPTSAITGEGIPDLLHLLVTLTQSRLTDRLMYVSELECTVLEVKVIEGLGTTIDVVLSNGYLNEGDKIVVCGLNGPIVTQVRALLTPQPLRELRVKSAYVHHKRVKAALGIKISAPDLEKAIAGSRLMVVGPDDDEEELRDAVMEDLQTLLKSIDKSGRGVCVQASTLGSLEALLEFLRTSKIPVSGINIGPVHKRDIIRASAMLEKAKEYAVMLAFDVEVDRDATQLADQLGVKVFTADIIYHLFDQFSAYTKEVTEQRRKEQAPSAVFPCVLKMIPGAIFSRRDPIIMGADVAEGTLRLGTPICVVQFDPATKKRDIINLGTVTGIEKDHKPVELVKKGMAGAGVAVKIECPPSDTPKLFGRHFNEKDEFYSRITRRSIDVLKESFRNDLSKEEWALVVKLKKILDVV